MECHVAVARALEGTMNSLIVISAVWLLLALVLASLCKILYPVEDEMRWVGNRYVDADGRIVADIDAVHGEFFKAYVMPRDSHSYVGEFISQADAVRAVERWWSERQVESFRLEEKA